MLHGTETMAYLLALVPTTGTENRSSIKANKSGLGQKCLSVLIKGIYYLFPDAFKMGNQLHSSQGDKGKGESGSCGPFFFFLCTLVTKMFIRNSQKTLIPGSFKTLLWSLQCDTRSRINVALPFLFFFLSYTRRVFMSVDTNHIRWVAAKSFFIYYSTSSHPEGEERVQGRLPCH